MTDSNNNHLIFGKNPVKEEILTGRSGTLHILEGLKLTDTALQESLKKNGIKTVVEKGSFFDLKLKGCNHQGFAFEPDDPPLTIYNENDLYESINIANEKTDTILVADSITDVGNMAALIRSALLFGVTRFVVSEHNSAPINNIVMKRSSGAAAHLNIYRISNISRVTDRLKNLGYWIYGADMDGGLLNKEVFAAKRVLIMGSEGKGLRDIIKKKCDKIISIPTTQKIDSLNVSVAAGIILYRIYAESPVS